MAEARRESMKSAFFRDHPQLLQHREAAEYLFDTLYAVTFEGGDDGKWLNNYVRKLKAEDRKGVKIAPKEPKPAEFFGVEVLPDYQWPAQETLQLQDTPDEPGVKVNFD